MLLYFALHRSSFPMSWRVMGRVIATTILFTLLASAAVADTLYLKSGTVLKGTFIGYENGQFIFELEDGKRVLYRPAEVNRLVVDRGDLAGDVARETGGRESSAPRRPDLSNGRPEVFQ